MQKSILLFFLGLFLQTSFLYASYFQVTPAQPQAGEKIDITYDPYDSSLAKSEVYGVAYVLELGESAKAYDLNMKLTKEGYISNFIVPETAQAVFFKFEDEAGLKSDSNNDEGYYTLVYKDGQPVENAYIMASAIYGEYADLFSIKANGDKAAEFFEKGLADPNDRFSEDYLKYYSIIVRITEDELGKEAILNHIKTSLENDNLTESALNDLASIARRVKAKDLSNIITERLTTDFPESPQAIKGKYSGFRGLETFEEKLAMYEEAYSKYNEVEELENTIDNMERTIAYHYGGEKDYENLYKYASRLSGVKSEAVIYNKYAYACTGGDLESEGYDLEKGLEMSMKSLELIANDMKTLDDKSPNYSDRQWRRGLESYYGYFADTYALLAHKNGDGAGAIKFQKIACESNKMEDLEVNSRYAIYLEKHTGAAEAETFLGEMIKEGNANSAMKEQYAKLYKMHSPDEQELEMHMLALEEEAKAKKIAKIKEAMIDEAAPDFALQNLNGELVSLESLKGKIVVIDFWATWCGPCKRSFPAMQQALEKFEDAEDVAFIFVDTWERGDTKAENAQKFIDDNGYTFNVLMDDENKMVSDFGVKGIPAKFILDGEGNIRISSTGYKGSEEGLIDEISLAVEVLRSDD